MTWQATLTTDTPYPNSQEHLLAGLNYVDLRVRWAVARARVLGLDPDDEFRGLYISESQIDDLLDNDLGHDLWAGRNGHTVAELPAELAQWPALIVQTRQAWETRTALSRAAGCPLLLDALARDFELTPLEVDALLLALTPEIDPRYERFFTYLQDDITKKRPSVNLLLNLLTDSFAEKLQLRRMFTDDGRLVASRLLVRFAEGGVTEPPLLMQYVRPAGRVVEHLLGHPGVDSRLAASAELLETPDSQPALRLPAGLQTQLQRALPDNPFFAFIGPYGVGKADAARHLAQVTGKRLLRVDLATLSESDVGLYEGLRLALRDAQLLNAILYLTPWDNLLHDNQPPARLFQMLLAYPGLVITAGEVLWQPANRRASRPVLTIPFHAPDFEERLAIWEQHLGEIDVDPRPVANHFRFTPGQIEDAVATARDQARWHDTPLTPQHLFAASRTHSNQKLSTLATKIYPRYQWSDIILPADTLQQLKEMVNTVYQRPTVYGQWGFDRKLALGKGLNALFAGESGTGKTMAADIIAGELGLDLYKIDLSSVVSKYIGETEKNLDKIFTEASTSNAILFFDEADAIFGKRSEVKDSHDRYANIETGYLLQRMEMFDGVVILATNLRANLDEAFTRRLHFAIEFPFPEPSDRERIWRVTFPPETPIAPDADLKLLAERFRLAGGAIRNIVLAAAFLAAESRQPVGMSHLLHATRREYQKMGRLIDERLFTA